MSVFDGMAGILTGALGGGLVTVMPATGVREIQALFREEPVEVDGSDGQPIMIESPSLHVDRTNADGLSRGVTVQPGNGKTYRIQNHIGTGNPGVDGMIVFELERVA